MVFQMATAYGLDAQRAKNLAIALEYFHTASLIFDDLPCMDNALERRGAPCAHLAFGEAGAILAALALINRAYALTWAAPRRMPDETPGRRRWPTSNSALAWKGLLNGQSLDLHYAALPHNRETTERIARGKTVSLIRLTLVLPAMLAALRRAKFNCWSGFALVWGLGYQIVDDLKDVLQSAAKRERPQLATVCSTGRTSRRRSAVPRRRRAPDSADPTWETGRCAGLLVETAGARLSLASFAAICRTNWRGLPRTPANWRWERGRDLSQADRDQSAPSSHSLVDQHRRHRLQRRRHADRGHHSARRHRHVFRASSRATARSSSSSAMSPISSSATFPRRRSARSPAGRWWLMPTRCSSESSPARIIPIITCFGVTADGRAHPQGHLARGRSRELCAARRRRGARRARSGVSCAPSSAAMSRSDMAIFHVIGILKTANGFEDGGVFMPLSSAQSFFHKEGSRR